MSVEETEVPEEVPKVPSKGKRKKIEEDVDKANITSKSADGHAASHKGDQAVSSENVDAKTVKVIGHPKTV